MSWLKRTREGLKSAPRRRELPDGLWSKCDQCGEILYQKELERNLWICRNCGHHFRVSAWTYVKLLVDDGSFVEEFADIVSVDPLKFRDQKRYPDRVKAAREKTGMNEAVLTGRARIDGHPLAVAVMDFAFMGGTLGSAVGEKITRTMEIALEERIPLVIVCTSGGARMQEGILSLMQMAKTSAALAALGEAKVPYVAVLTNPTTAGVSASYASLGDVIVAEPKALIGFAGPRVIEQTINQELPPGFQRAEFLLDHGLLDTIVPRTDLRSHIATLLWWFRAAAAGWNASDLEPIPAGAPHAG
jgi:acetyl-CoA carboxylase carboxyl transferase subunit beta